MKKLIKLWAAWSLVKFQFMTTNFDPEVLQWPGGSLIAFFLWFYATLASFWSLSPDGSVTLQEAAR